MNAEERRLDEWKRAKRRRLEDLKKSFPPQTTDARAAEFMDHYYLLPLSSKVMAAWFANAPYEDI